MNGSGSDNGPGNGSGTAFFPKLKDEIGQISFRILVDHFVRRESQIMIHPHVERAVLLKTKSTLCLFQLQ